MTNHFYPFTPELFHQQTGLNADDNEAIYIRWVNTSVNLANYKAMQEMTGALKEIIELLRQNALKLPKENKPAK